MLGTGSAAMQRLLDSGAPFDALFIASDLMARGALAVLGRAGIRVPEDVAIMGFDDSPVAVAVQPAADIGGIVATGITIAQSAWGDALAEVLMRGRGYTWAEFMTTHPAGAVGRLEDLPADADRIVIPAYREVAS